MGFNLAAAGLRLPSLSELMSVFDGRRQRIRASLKLKRRFTQALLEAGNGRSPMYLARPLKPAEQRILMLAGVDLLRLVQGAARERIVRTLTKFHARETLQTWIRDPNPQLRAKAAEGLGYIADSHGCLSLSRALDDDDNHVRFAAAASLVRLGVAPPVEQLMTSFGLDTGQCTRLWRMLDMMRANHPDRPLAVEDADGAVTAAPSVATAP